MVNGNFRKSKISWKVEDLGRFRALNHSGVLAGANFIALRRAGLEFKCLVEWLHRREIAPAGGNSVTIAGGNFPIFGHHVVFIMHGLT